MSVYTRVSSTQLETFLQNYDLGKLSCFEGIKEGITNTNYHLTTSTGNFVLTLYEFHAATDLDYILGLQHYLHANGINCAAPVTDLQGRFYSSLNDRPAAINNRVCGKVCALPGVSECEKIGLELARMHLAGSNYEQHRSNPRGLNWCRQAAAKLESEIPVNDQQLIKSVFNAIDSFTLAGLPVGALHADLFHDNALFDGDNLGGIIDFDYACNDIMVYDLAITMNDWCIDKSGQLETDRLSALIKSYETVRLLSNQERSAIPQMLQLAALRFWLSRLYDKTMPLAGELTFIKDPDQFKNMLILRIDRKMTF